MKSRKFIMFFFCVVCMLATSVCTVVASNKLGFDDCSQSEGIKADEWMKSLNDTLPVSSISMPGTHDSGAIRGGKALRTQSTTIVQQLEAGIRAFDIRLKNRKGKLGVYHSIVFQHTYWEEDVLPAMIAFLQKHPSEMLVVSLKCEGGNISKYTSLLYTSLQRTDYSPYIVSSFDKELSLGECRGKILFLHRDDAGENYKGVRCEGWKDNSSCVMTLRDANGNIVKTWLQDKYQYSSGNAIEIEKKKQAIIHYFKKMSQQNITLFQWGISFISATGLPKGTPLVFADRLNGTIADYLTNNNQRHCGIVFIDFVADADGQRLVDTIIRSNSL